MAKRYSVQVVRFADVQKEPALHFHTGSASSERDVNILIGKNVNAGRILAGVTFSKPGNWTSWPPHEHARMLEEAYLYIDMPSPAWGIQLVYSDPANPERKVLVLANLRDGAHDSMTVKNLPNGRWKNWLIWPGTPSTISNHSSPLMQAGDVQL